MSHRLDAELTAIVADPALPLASLAALAVRHGDVAYEGHFGRRRIGARDRGGDRPANRDTLFRVASLSKLAVALGAMRLVEAGRLDLDRDVSEALGWKLANPHFPGSTITLRMLLAHTSSLRDGAGYHWDRRHRLRDALQPGGALHGAGAMWSPKAPPGAYFAYANLPWGVIAEAMEAVTGERFDRLMRRLVLEPLGVPGGFEPAELRPEDRANLATLYRKRAAGDDTAAWDADGPWIAQVDDYAGAAPMPRADPGYVPGTNGTLFAPQGGLRTSARGLARILRLFLDDGRCEGRPFLRPASVAAMLACEWRHDPAQDNGDARSEAGHPGLFNAWGLGVQHFRDTGGPGRGDRLVDGGGFTGHGHLGTAYGLTATLAFDRATGHGLVALVGGTGADPEAHRGTHSALGRHDERILTALWRHAILEP